MYSSSFLAKYSLHFLGNQSRASLRHSGTNATFSCVAKLTSVPLHSVSPTVAIKRAWYKNGHLLTMHNTDARFRFSKEPNNEAAILRLKNLKAEDQGVYECVAWLSDSSHSLLSDKITAQFNLTVKEGKSFLDTDDSFKLQSVELNKTKTLRDEDKMPNSSNQNSIEQDDFEESEFNGHKGNSDSSNESESEDDDEEDDIKMVDEKISINCELAAQSFLSKVLIEFDLLFPLAPPIFADQFRGDKEPTYRRVSFNAGQVVQIECPLRGHSNSTDYFWFKDSSDKPLKGKLRKNGEEVKFKLRFVNKFFIYIFLNILDEYC